MAAFARVFGCRRPDICHGPGFGLPLPYPFLKRWMRLSEQPRQSAKAELFTTSASALS
jgi:hypothetical protein